MEVLRGWVSARLNGIKVIWTLFERHVQPLKARAHPLYNYSGVKDPTQERTEELSVDVVRRRVVDLVVFGTTIRIEGAPNAFSASFRPSLVSFFLCFRFQ